MRLSKVLKLSFVGTLVFSPSMAQDAGKVHEEALKVLRSQGGTTTPATVGGQESRAERDARLKAETQQRLTERDRLQAEKRRQFEEYVKERERLRDQRSGSANDAQRQALDVLRNQQTPPPAQPVPAATIAQPAAAPRVTSAPTVTAAPAAPVYSTPAVSAPASPADTHQKALEILRQQTQPSAPATVIPAVAPTTAPVKNEVKPSADLQRRLNEIQRELEAPNARSGSTDSTYVRDLEQRALSSASSSTSVTTKPAVTSQPAVTSSISVQPAQPSAAAATVISRSSTTTTTTAPAVDAQTREMLRRQNEQLARESSSVAAVPLDTGAETRAREILRQQQQAVATQPATTIVSQSAPAPVTTRPAPVIAQTPPPAAISYSSAPVSEVQYSRDLEERARQAVLARSQSISEPQAQIPAATYTAPAASATPAYQFDRVHTQAEETLVQIDPTDGGSTQLKSKQDRLRALTDLYRADRLTPAEYHQRRAALLAEAGR